MHPAWLWLSTVGHYIPLLPLLWVLGLRAVERPVSDQAKVLVAAMMLSFLADQGGVAMAGSGPTWWLTYLYAPLQVTLWLVAGVRSQAFRLVFVALIGLLAVTVAAKGPLNVPETVVGVIGGGLACLAFATSPYRRAMWTYCGLAIPGLIWQGYFDPNDPRWLWGWGYYEAVRVVGLVLLTWTITREAAGANGTDQTARRANRPVGGHPAYRAGAAPQAAFAAGYPKDARRVTR